MSRHVSPSTNRPYGVLLVTRVWGTSRATIYRHRQCDATRPRRRPGPLGPLADAALLAAIRELLTSNPFHGEATGKSGRGCGSPASAPPSAASCG